MFRRTFSIAAAMALAAAVALAGAGPAAAQSSSLTISGKVTSATTSQPISGVCITIGVPGQFCWTSTNATGDYFIDLSAQGAQSGQQWDLFFIKGGYTTHSSPKITVSGPTTYNASLTPNGQPISTAPPPPCVNFQPPGCAINQPPAGPPAQTYTVYLPNIVKTLGGVNGWHTPFIIQNIGGIATDISVGYYSFSGEGAAVASRTATIQPGRSYVESPRDAADLPGNSQFSVVITSTGAPVVAVVNEHQGPGAGNEALSYTGASGGANTVYLPLVSNMVGGWLTTLIMQNVGSAPATMIATFNSLDGTKTASISKTAAPGRSAFIDPRFEAGLTAGLEYAVAISSGQPIVVVANNHNDLPGTVNPMGDSYSGIAATPGTTYLPYIAKNTDGIGRNSRVIVQNAGPAAATPSIQLHPFGGGSPINVTAPSLQPGSAFAFTPTGPDGEYSATIGGGTFAAVATAISPQTAMYYAGSHRPGKKLYMPNVTRKLTAGPPDPGWNTPILIQSAGATSGTLSWYRFSDGSLVTSQTITLTANRTTRVDPALVSGLTDNSQYAVVFESTGDAVAIVVEINLIGGDDAMIYGAFLSP